MSRLILWESDSTHENITYKRARGQLQGTGQTVSHETQITKRIHKRSTALERSVRKLLEDLNKFDGTQINTRHPPIKDLSQCCH